MSSWPPIRICANGEVDVPSLSDAPNRAVLVHHAPRNRPLAQSSYLSRGQLSLGGGGHLVSFLEGVYLVMHHSRPQRVMIYTIVFLLLGSSTATFNVTRKCFVSVFKHR